MANKIFIDSLMEKMTRLKIDSNKVIKDFSMIKDDFPDLNNAFGMMCLYAQYLERQLIVGQRIGFVNPVTEVPFRRFEVDWF